MTNLDFQTIDDLFTIIPDIREAQENNQIWFVNILNARTLAEALTPADNKEATLLDKIKFCVTAHDRNWNTDLADGRRLYPSQLGTLLAMINRAINTYATA